MRAALRAFPWARLAREPRLNEALPSMRGCPVLTSNKCPPCKTMEICGPEADIGIKKVPVPLFHESHIVSAGTPLHHLISHRGLCHHGGVSWIHLFSKVDSHGCVTLFLSIWSSRNICFLETVKVANGHFNKNHASHL